MKKIFILFSLLFISQFVYTQTVDGQFVVVTNDGVTYSVKVQIKLQSGGPQELGNATIRFTFNESDLSFPASPTEGVNYSFQNFQGGNYSSSVSRPSTNTVSINIALPSGSGTEVNTSYIDVVTINLSVSNSAGNSNLVWETRELYSPGSVTAWTLGSWPNKDTSPLPVELSSFMASVKQNVVNLQWRTQTEVNNYGFEVERASSRTSPGQESWIKIGFVTGNGNSNSPKDYSYTDKNLTGGSKFTYRLKQVDNDGTYSYSSEVEVEVIPDRYELYQNYPNPFNPVTNIKFSLPEAAKVKVDIFNIIGEKVRTLIDQNMEAGFHNIAFNAENLSSGTYIYRLQTENFTQIKKMLLLK